MKSTGQILVESRLARKMEIEDVARITKIRPEFLHQLESDEYSRLPSGTIARGFIRNYALFLGLNPDHILAVFRRDFVENQDGRIIPRGMVEPVTKSSLWSPKTTVIAGVTLLFTIFIGYLIYQYTLLTGPPSLTISRPQDNITVTENTIEISGRTDPEATLSANGQLVVLEDGGNFYFRMPLDEGTNQITVTATGKSGRSRSLSRTVTFSK